MVSLTIKNTEMLWSLKIVKVKMKPEAGVLMFPHKPLISLVFIVFYVNRKFP